jgi:molecular chaperone GrpE
MAQGVPHSEGERIATEPVDSASLLADNQSLRDRLMRALAEGENARRRAERSLEETRQYSIAQFAREMLSVVDNLRRALDTAEQNSERSGQDAAMLEGVRSTERILMQALEQFGIRKFEAMAEPFDPARHEAVMEIDDLKREQGTIGRVVEDGYMIRDRLLRPARVAVVKWRTEAPDREAQQPIHQP